MLTVRGDYLSVRRHRRQFLWCAYCERAKLTFTGECDCPATESATEDAKGHCEDAGPLSQIYYDLRLRGYPCFPASPHTRGDARTVPVWVSSTLSR